MPFYIIYMRFFMVILLGWGTIYIDTKIYFIVMYTIIIFFLFTNVFFLFAQMIYTYGSLTSITGMQKFIACHLTGIWLIAGCIMLYNEYDKVHLIHWVAKFALRSCPQLKCPTLTFSLFISCNISYKDYIKLLVEQKFTRVKIQVLRWLFTLCPYIILSRDISPDL